MWIVDATRLQRGSASLIGFARELRESRKL